MAASAVSSGVLPAVPVASLLVRGLFDVLEDGRFSQGLVSNNTGASYDMAAANCNARVYVGQLGVSPADGSRRKVGVDFVDWPRFDLVMLPGRDNREELELAHAIEALRAGDRVECFGFLQYRVLRRGGRPMLTFRPSSLVVVGKYNPDAVEG